MDFKDKIKTIGVARLRGTERVKLKVDERDGSIGGYERERWDDSQDAVVKPKSVKLKLAQED